MIFSHPAVLKYGADILFSDGMNKERAYIQHSDVSCYDHSVSVANMSVRLARYMPFPANIKSLVRGALLHDYFLYDWHTADPAHKLHGFTHARRALKNAEKDFPLNHIERDIIEKHMFPLNIRMPRCRESWIVCAADKLCALMETVLPRLKTYGIHMNRPKNRYGAALPENAAGNRQTAITG